MHPLVIQIERIKERTADTCAFPRSPVRIGRNPLNDVLLEEAFVSQWHGVFRFDEAGTTYVDLGSTNPTLIDGKPVQRNLQVPVQDTTDIRIGNYRLHVLRVPAPPELFGKQRKSAFASGDAVGAQNIESTMFMVESSAQAPAPRPAPRPAPLPAAQATSFRTGLPSPAHFAPPPRAAAAEAPSMLGRRIGTGPAENPARPLPMRDAARPGSAALAENPARPLSALEAARNEALSSSDSAVHHRPPPLPPRSTAPVSSPPGDPLAQRYAEYQQGFSALLVEVRQRLERADSTRRAEVLDELLRKYPDLGQRSELRSLMVELGLNPLRSGVPEMEDWLRRLTDNMFPPPGVPVNIALAMERIGALLEVFGTAFIELRGAHEQFCNEMSLDRAPDSTMLRTTSNVRVALAYLLNSSTDSSSKVEELARGMADFALHQVALVNAVVDGARALLEELSPKGLREQHDKTGKKPKRGMFSGMFSSESDALVARYETAFAELLDEDRFTRKLFGRAFARKYYAIMGGRDTSPSLRQRD